SPDPTGLPEYQHDLDPFSWHNCGNTYRALANCLGQTGRAEEADSAIAHAIRIHQKLVADFPHTHHYWTALFRDYRDQGTLCWRSGRKDQADDPYKRTQELGERMVAAFPPPHGVCYDVARFLVGCPNPKYRKLQRGIELATISWNHENADFGNTLAIG